MRQKLDALLLIGVGARDDGDGGLLSRVDGKMRDIRADIDEVAGAGLNLVFEPLAIIGRRFARDHVDRRLVRDMLMRLGARAGRDREKLEIDARGADALRGNAGLEAEPLLAGDVVTGANMRAGYGLFLRFAGGSVHGSS